MAAKARLAGRSLALPPDGSCPGEPTPVPRSHRVDGRDVSEFLEYALQGMVDELDEELGLIRGQQLGVHLRNYVCDVLRDASSATGELRRRLVLDLSDAAEPIPFTELRHISPRVTELYARKSHKTLRRDIDLLEERGLIVRTKEGVRANRELAQAFLPRTHPSGRPRLRPP